MTHQYLLPSALTDKDMQIRKAGFEFEFGNLPVLQTAAALQQSLGGEIDAKSPFEVILRGSILGKLRIERDANILKSVKYRKWLKEVGVEFFPGSIVHNIESNIDNASRLLIPCEVVTEPIPFNELNKLDTLVETLKSLGAQGTQDSLIYAFGLHINPSIPSDSVDTLLRYMQAFLLLHTWIIDFSSIDLTRRFLTKYIDPFPAQYLELVLSEEYTPDINAFTEDYLEHNSTRNRALDMLPILCCLNRERVLEAVSAEERNLVKGRPAFHYRLPDCKLNVPGWSPHQPWNQWFYIERLASDDALLAELIAEWQLSNDTFTITPRTSWAIRLTSILSQKFLEQ